MGKDRKLTMAERMASQGAVAMGRTMQLMFPPKVFAANINDGNVIARGVIERYSERIAVSLRGRFPDDVSATCSLCGDTHSPRVCQHGVAFLYAIGGGALADQECAVFRFSMTIDGRGTGLRCDVSATYRGVEYRGDRVFNEERASIPNAAEVLTVLRSYGFENGPEGFVLELKGKGIGDARRAIGEGFRLLTKFGEVRMGDGVEQVGRVKDPRIRITLEVREARLCVSASSDHLSPNDLAGYLTVGSKCYTGSAPEYLTSNGALVAWCDASREAAAFLDMLNVPFRSAAFGIASQPIAGAFKARAALDCLFPKLHADTESLDAFLAEAAGLDDNFVVPRSLEGVLKDWQVQGFFRLQQAYYTGAGVIFSDDMGMGKTVQILAHVLALARDIPDHSGPIALICVPASLVNNWEREIERFTPELTHVVVRGASKHRHALIKNVASDIVITTYDVLWRDAGAYRTAGWSPEVFALDESQLIKNGDSKRAKGAKSLFPCAQRLAISGTPIENSLSDLWSLVSFVTGGGTEYLGRRRQFNAIKRRIEAGDAAARAFLEQLVRPLILRRTNDLLELPELSVVVRYVDLDPESRNIYFCIKEQLVTQLNSMSDDEYDHDMNVLVQILRLRQCCFDPSLAGMKYSTGFSSKTVEIVEILKEIDRRGEKAIVYTDMVAGFKSLERLLEREGIRYLIMTGKTPKEMRDSLVEKFNSADDDSVVFLMSLRVGGLGLNVIGPQGAGRPLKTVINATPWWNPQVRRQSCGRAYRFGQNNNITEINLLARDTYEQRIWNLQREKIALADGILGTYGLERSKLTRQELINILQDTADSRLMPWD